MLPTRPRRWPPARCAAPARRPPSKNRDPGLLRRDVDQDVFGRHGPLGCLRHANAGPHQQRCGLGQRQSPPRPNSCPRGLSTKNGGAAPGSRRRPPCPSVRCWRKYRSTSSSLIERIVTCDNRRRHQRVHVGAGPWRPAPPRCVPRACGRPGAAGTARPCARLSGFPSTLPSRTNDGVGCQDRAEHLRARQPARAPPQIAFFPARSAPRKRARFPRAAGSRRRRPDDAAHGASSSVSKRTPIWFSSFTPTRTARCEVDIGHAGSALNGWI